MDGLIIFGAKYLIFAIGLLALVFWKYKNLKWQFVGAIVIAVVTAVILSKIAGKIYYHPRPFVVEHIKPLIPHGNDNGFPSDHTTLSTAVASVVYFYNKKAGLGLLLLALIVGLSRIAAHVHSPVDIIGGLILGAIAGWFGWRLSIWLTKGRSQTTTAESPKRHQ